MMKRILLLILLIPVIAFSTTTTPVFICGFEEGYFAGIVAGGAPHWGITGANYSSSTSTVRSGARSIRFNSTFQAGYIESYASWTAANIAVIRIYVRYASLPSNNAAVFSLGGAGVRFNAGDSKLYAYGSALGATGVSVTTGTWYRIDCIINASSNPWTINAKIDGTDCGQATNAAAAQNFSTMIIGNAVTNSTADVFFDDLCVSTTSADYPIGAGNVYAYVPVSDGIHNVAGTNDFESTLTGTDIVNTTTTAFQLVDDQPIDHGSGTDWINMVAPPNAGDYVQCLFGAASGSSTVSNAPIGIDVIAGIHQAGTGTGNMEIRLNDNGTTNAMYTATAVAGVTTISHKRKLYVTAPTGGAWTTSGNGNINNLKVQFGSPATVDANPDQFFDYIMIEMEIPVQATRPRRVTIVN